MLPVRFGTLPEPTKISAKTADTLVLAVLENKKLTAAGERFDKALGGALSAAIKYSDRFEGKTGETLAVLGVTPRVLLVGLGDSKATEASAETIGANIVAALNGLGSAQAIVIAETGKGFKLSEEVLAARIGVGAALRHYRFDKYKTQEKPAEKLSLKQLTVATVQPKKAQQLFDIELPVVESVLFTRDLVTEPANVIHPESLAVRCQGLKKIGLTVEVLGEEQMRKLGMGALLGVGQGSVRESKLVVLRWNGKPADKKAPLAFVGKGVTFDTGGISIKPSGGMEEMKWDMAGAGAVIGLLRALAARKAKVNAVGVVGLVENMPDGNAQRPGDVVTTMSGQTVEVINTDAEGRLVLADALWYTQNRFKPKLMVDLATLTGAVIVALGSSRAGLFANDDTLAERLVKAGDAVSEILWRLPLGEEYTKQVRSEIADWRNVGEAREAGSTAGAVFLEQFINKTTWAHLDIAGTAWANKAKGVTPKGASGFGIRLLDRFVRDHYEG